MATNRQRWQAASRTRNSALQSLRGARQQHTTTGTLGLPSLTVAGWLRRWLEDVARPTVSLSTWRDYVTPVRRHLIPSLGGQKLARLTPGDVRATHQRVGVRVRGEQGAPGASPGTVRCRAREPRRRNAARLVRTLTIVSPRRALSAGDVRRILAASRAQPRDSRCIAALLTGVRQGELLGLQWDRVDLDAGTADLAWQVACAGLPARPPPPIHGPWMREAACRLPPRPKSSAGRRVIPLPPILVDALRRRAMTPPPSGWCGRPATADRSSPATTSRPGTPSSSAQACPAALCTRPTTPPRHCSKNNLRIDITVIQSIVGHAQPLTTQRPKTRRPDDE